MKSYVRLFHKSAFLLLFLALIEKVLATGYYVNDGSVDADDISTASGNDANDGLSTSTPKRTISNLISTYALTGGDIIYIDAGTFAEPITFTSSDDGTSDASLLQVIGRGITKTHINPAGEPANAVLYLSGANYIKFKDLHFKCQQASSSGVYGVKLENADYIIIQSCSLNVVTGANAVLRILDNGSENSDFNEILNCTLTNDGSGGGVDIVGLSSTQTTNNKVYDCTITMSGSTGDGIWLRYANNTVIFRNRISNGDDGIEINSTGGAGNTDIYNNYITNSATRGFFNNGPASTSTTGTLRFNSFYSAQTCTYFDSNNTSWDVRNNIFYSTGTSTLNYCIRVEGSNTFSYCDFNCFYHPGDAQSGRFNGTSYAALANWKTLDHSSETGKTGDESSIENDPSYKNPATNNLDLNSGSVCFDAGTTIAGISTDIYQSTRTSPPTIGAYDEATTLPVELLLFDYRCTANKLELFWETASELNNSYFVIQKSNEGAMYHDAGKIPGSGNSSVRINYQYFDFNVLQNVYYRLIQVDLDGREHAYPPIFINECKKQLAEGFDVFYVREENQFIITVTSPAQDNFNLKIYDLPGRCLSVTKINSEKDTTFITLSVINMRDGIYFISLENGNGITLAAKKMIVY